MTAISLPHPAHHLGRLVTAIVILAVVASAWLVVRTGQSAATHTKPAVVSHLAPASPQSGAAQTDRWICRVGRPC
jgi:hypothetical protein